MICEFRLRMTGMRTNAACLSSGYGTAWLVDRPRPVANLIFGVEYQFCKQRNYNKLLLIEDNRNMLRSNHMDRKCAFGGVGQNKLWVYNRFF